ncbi:MAG: sugar porter family MFS transporter [Flavobacteriaceae bacterium]|jgi:sugar porter (SP) family MFS transporter|nr:sugar porter family MFS transporter [Flavobacteriaceae bacterium]MBT6127702.1 sugar porter family MFS transporter [Flavobacteriaceae bacterium]MDG1027404.1 sugar porter family MFS transporter [Flavobacteriaceae bacterium]MDG1942460.1 sugar porter family MFS transporter [Flavobacteriaceae bacterium]
MPKSFRWILVAALSGFLFGFDTVVISGANLPIKELWSTSPFFHGFFIMSMALWGTVLGALFGSYPTNKLGRKKTLTWIGFFFLISALGSALAVDPYTFSFFRFVGGVAVGVSSIAAPIYISEISTSENRGRLGVLYQFSLVFGILIAFFSNYLLTGFQGSSDWRWMLGVEAIPALMYLLLTLYIPDTPRWQIIFQKDDSAALKTLNQIYGDGQQADSVLKQIKTADSTAGNQEKLMNNSNRKTLLLAFLISFFNQLSGINFILYYAPEILEMAGFATRASLFNSVLIGLTNIVFTFLGLMLIDKLGRKQLLIMGSLGYIFSLSGVSMAFYFQTDPQWIALFIFAFIASHAVGQGTVIWVFISEIFPNRIRAKGQSFGAGVHWVFAALITLVGPSVIAIFKANPWPIFSFFALMMVLQLIFSIFTVPETKGKSLEEINSIINKD